MLSRTVLRRQNFQLLKRMFTYKIEHIRKSKDFLT
jgi:hypothetical protein